MLSYFKQPVTKYASGIHPVFGAAVPTLINAYFCPVLHKALAVPIKIVTANKMVKI